ncbi:MAG: hypothetical protein GY930_13430 [bacterium]|nr:hypothetical protein [bacterium]
MKHLIGTAILATTLVGLSSAQTATIFGEYDTTELGGAPSAVLHIYVDSSLPANGNGTVCSEFNNLDSAITAANAFAGRATINLAGGSYTTSVGMRGHGIALEAWPKSAALASSPVVIEDAVGSTSPILRIDSEGPSDLPDTIIRGIVFQPRLQSMQPTVIGLSIDAGVLEEPLAVEVTRCRFQNLLVGVSIVSTLSPISNNHMIYDNDFFQTEFEEGLPNASVAIDIVSNGTSCTLVRSNRITRWGTGVSVLAEEGGSANPRIMSNTMQLCKTGVRAVDADVHATNNTIAFMLDFGSGSSTCFSQSRGRLDLFNNVLWNVAGAPTGIRQSLALTGAPLLTASSNLTSPLAPSAGSVPGATLPGFVGGNTHPGKATPSDLHLALGSMLIDAGDDAAIGNFSSPTTPALAASSGASRIDVSMDVDRDPRWFGGRTDVGADEFCNMVGLAGVRNMPLRIEISNSTVGATWDSLGNLLPDANGSYVVDIDVTGPPMGFFGLFGGLIYMDTTSAGMTIVENKMVYQNLLHPWGNVLCDLTSGFSSALFMGLYLPQGGMAAPTSTVQLDANGQGKIRLDFGSVAPSHFESEVALQATMFDVFSTTGELRNSNQLLVELNNACGK